MNARWMIPFALVVGCASDPPAPIPGCGPLKEVRRDVLRRPEP